MDIPQLGLHVPEWILWIGVILGVALSTYQTNRTAKSVRASTVASFAVTNEKTEALTQTVKGNTDRYAEMMVQQQQMAAEQQRETRELMMMVIGAKDADIKELRETVRTLTKDIEGFKTLTEAQAVDNEKQSSAMRSVETQLQAVTTQLATDKEFYTREIKRLSDQLQDKAFLLADKDTELEARAKEILELTQKLQEYQALEARVTTLQADVDQLKRDIDAMNEEKAALQKRVTELEAERDAANKRAEQAERERDEARAELAVEKKKQTDQLPPLPVETPTDAT